MYSTMQDVQLTVSRILKHGMTIHGKSIITTWTGEPEPQRRTFAEAGARAHQLANALRDELGVTGDQRIATLMWNNSEHVEAYFAIPSMGAVLHTLNLRLPPEQLVWIVNHAADRVVLVNGSLLPSSPRCCRTCRRSSTSWSRAPGTVPSWTAWPPASTTTRN